MRQRIAPLAGALGLLGSAACSLAMLLALAGLAGAGAVVGSAGDGMAGMGAQQPSSQLGSVLLFLVQKGPAILTVSIAAMLLATARAQRRVLLPVAAGGFALYWGMYLQPNHLVMDIAIALGFSDLDGRVYVDADRSPDIGLAPAGVTTNFAIRASLP